VKKNLPTKRTYLSKRTLKRATKIISLPTKQTRKKRTSRITKAKSPETKRATKRHLRLLSERAI
jgi:hypothetical protein